MQARVDAVRDAVEKTLAEFDTKAMRPLQKSAFLCSAKCADAGGSDQAYQQCLQGCMGKVTAAEQAMNAELGQLQERMQRCLAVCQDRAADVVRDDPNAQAKAQGVLESCVGECADRSRAEVPKLMGRMLKAHKP